MHRREHEVPGLGGLERDRDRLEIAHLADQHDVGILAQRGAERGLERRRVLPDLSLRHERLFPLVHELDRIFDGDDVIGAGAIDDVEQRAQRGRLPRSRRAGDEHQSAAELRQPLHGYGSPSSSAVMMRIGICRKTAAGPCRSVKTLTRKRARPTSSYA